jgi:hypothetical protein
MVMTRSGIVTSYLMNITEIHDQLVAVGEKVEYEKLVNMALNGFQTSWEPFFKGIFTQEFFL